MGVKIYIHQDILLKPTYYAISIKISFNGCTKCNLKKMKTCFTESKDKTRDEIPLDPRADIKELWHIKVIRKQL